MKKVKVNNFGKPAGLLIEGEGKYSFEYFEDYSGPPISLTMPVEKTQFTFNEFPPFFDGLLPEGNQLDALLRQTKIDRNDCFSQLIIIGGDLVGSVTVEKFE